jgi:hypothetical protein
MTSTVRRLTRALSSPWMASPTKSTCPPRTRRSCVACSSPTLRLLGGLVDAHLVGAGARLVPLPLVVRRADARRKPPKFGLGRRLRATTSATVAGFPPTSSTPSTRSAERNESKEPYRGPGKCVLRGLGSPSDIRSHARTQCRRSDSSRRSRLAAGWSSAQPAHHPLCGRFSRVGVTPSNIPLGDPAGRDLFSQLLPSPHVSGLSVWSAVVSRRENVTEVALPRLWWAHLSGSGQDLPAL